MAEAGAPDRAPRPAPRPGPDLSRRRLFGGTAAGLGLAATAGTAAAWPALAADAVHQPGITSPPLPSLCLAGLDLITASRDSLSLTLRTLSGVIQALTEGAEGRLTVTVGLGPSLFTHAGLGLQDRRPGPLRALPAFRHEALDAAGSDGDLGIQVCAGSPTAAHQALRTLVNAVRPLAMLRWRQVGYRPDTTRRDPRGMFGFRDGTANLAVDDPDATADHLWVTEGPEWLHGGTYQVVRRIRLLLDTWDRTPVADQEAVIGRRLDDNSRIDSLPGAHSQLSQPERNGGTVLLRRSYSYDAGADPNGLQDSGLIFIAFQRDPMTQYVPLQRRLAEEDPLNAFSQHVASALFACPPRPAAGSWLGAELFR